MQQVGEIALFGGRRAEMLESLVRIVERVEAGAPAFVAEGRIGDHEVEGFELPVVAGEPWVRQRVALLDLCRRVVVQDHVHPRQAGRGGVLLLTVERDLGVGFVTHFQQQRTRAAGWVIHGGVVGGNRFVDTDDPRHDAADFGRRVELAFALAALGSEVAHQVFVGVAENVVAVCAVFAEIERLVLEDRDQIGQPVDNLLTAAKFARIVEIRHIGQLVGVGQRPDDLLVDLIADVRLALEGDHVLETGTFGDGYRRIRDARVLVGDVFDEQQDENVVLILASVHAAAQFVTGGPKGGIEFGFLDGHFMFLSSLQARLEGSLFCCS